MQSIIDLYTYIPFSGMLGLVEMKCALRKDGENENYFQLRSLKYWRRYHDIFIKDNWKVFLYPTGSYLFSLYCRWYSQLGINKTKLGFISMIMKFIFSEKNSNQVWGVTSVCRHRYSLFTIKSPCYIMIISWSDKAKKQIQFVNWLILATNLSIFQVT